MYQRLSLQGVSVDIDPAQLEPTVWTGAENMLAKPGRMERATGWEEIWPTPVFAPFWLLYTPQLQAQYWLYAGEASLGVVDEGGNHADITPASLTDAVDRGEWSGGNLSGISVVNSPENEPYYWFEGQPVALPLPGQRSSQTRYQVIRPFQYHLIGMGVESEAGSFRDQLHWSSAADPGQIPATWLPEPGNEAGDNTLADEPGAIVDGAALRNSFYIYKRDSVYEMTYIGGNEVFSFRKVFGNTGVLGLNCIARVEGTHVVLGNGDIYRHDGQNMSSIVEGRVREAFFSAIDEQNFRNSFVVHLEQQHEVWFCIPTTGQTRPDLALVWNVNTNEFGYRRLNNIDYGASGIVAPAQGAALESWDSDAGQWAADQSEWLRQALSSTEDSILFADFDGTRLLQGDTGQLDIDQPYMASLTRLGLDMGNPEVEKAVRRIMPRINAPEGTLFTLRLFNQRDYTTDQEAVGVYQFVANAEAVPVNINARFLGVTISCDEAVRWDISGFDVEYMLRGRF